LAYRILSEVIMLEKYVTEIYDAVAEENRLRSSFQRVEFSFDDRSMDLNPPAMKIAEAGS